MNAIILMLLAAGGLTIPPPPEEPVYHVVTKRSPEGFYGYVVGGNSSDGAEVVEYRLDEPLRAGTVKVHKIQEPVETKEIRATRERRWVKQFAERGYAPREVNGAKEFFPESELNLADRALEMAQAVAADNPPPPPLPEKPAYVENPDESVAEVKPPGFVRLWGPQIFLFLFTAAVVAYLVKTFLLKETEAGD